MPQSPETLPSSESQAEKKAYETPQKACEYLREKLDKDLFKDKDSPADARHEASIEAALDKLGLKYKKDQDGKKILAFIDKEGNEYHPQGKEAYANRESAFYNSIRKLLVEKKGKSFSDENEKKIFLADPQSKYQEEMELLKEVYNERVSHPLQIDIGEGETEIVVDEEKESKEEEKEDKPEGEKEKIDISIEAYRKQKKKERGLEEKTEELELGEDATKLTQFAKKEYERKIDGFIEEHRKKIVKKLKKESEKFGETDWKLLKEAQKEDRIMEEALRQLEENKDYHKERQELEDLKIVGDNMEDRTSGYLLLNRLAKRVEELRKDAGLKKRKARGLGRKKKEIKRVDEEEGMLLEGETPEDQKEKLKDIKEARGLMESLSRSLLEEDFDKKIKGLSEEDRKEKKWEMIRELSETPEEAKGGIRRLYKKVRTRVLKEETKDLFKGLSEERKKEYIQGEKEIKVHSLFDSLLTLELTGDPKKDGAEFNRVLRESGFKTPPKLNMEKSDWRDYKAVRKKYKKYAKKGLFGALSWLLEGLNEMFSVEKE